MTFNKNNNNNNNNSNDNKAGENALPQAKVTHQNTKASRVMLLPRQYTGLVQKIAEVFAAGMPATLSYRDEDDDAIVFSSQEEYDFALAYFDQKQGRAKLSFKTDTPPMPTETAMEATAAAASISPPVLPSAPPAAYPPYHHPHQHPHPHPHHPPSFHYLAAATSNNNSNSNSNSNSNNIGTSVPPPTHGSFHKAWRVTNRESAAWPAGLRLMVAPKFAEKSEGNYPRLLSADMLNQPINDAPVMPREDLHVVVQGSVPLIPRVEPYRVKYRLAKPATPGFFDKLSGNTPTSTAGSNAAMEKVGPPLYLEVLVQPDFSVVVLDDDAGAAKDTARRDYGHGCHGRGHGHGHNCHGHGHGHHHPHPGQPGQHGHPGQHGGWRGGHAHHQPFGFAAPPQAQPMQTQPMQTQPMQAQQQQQQQSLHPEAMSKQDRKAFKARIAAAKKANNVDELVAILVGLGFRDEAVNRELLVKNDNKIRKVYKILSHQQQQQQQRPAALFRPGHDDDDEDGDDD